MDALGSGAGNGKSRLSTATGNQGHAHARMMHEASIKEKTRRGQEGREEGEGQMEEKVAVQPAPKSWSKP